ncbi:MAG: hypothetical protein V4754_09825 [Pseudomonadota bacterium]
MSFMNRFVFVCTFFFSILPISSALAKNILYPGETLSRGQYIISGNGEYQLIMQIDGSLLMYRKNGSVRYRMGKHGTHATMQADGNFVEYSGKEPLWNSETHSAGAWLQIYDDGNLMITGHDNSTDYVAWSIGSDTDSQNVAVYGLDVKLPSAPMPSTVPTANYPDTIPID